ncbi:hypothetical protein ENBRE01_3149 [Enteropsectra breve]|nr:hypothetical protein ENBRE01_3149 [Enteropsectra breve]
MMVWGCFSYGGVGKITIIDGNINSLKYTKSLDTCMVAAASKMGLLEYTFQQDNDPKHRSKHTKDYFKDKKINVMAVSITGYESDRASLGCIEEKCKGKEA